MLVVGCKKDTIEATPNRTQMLAVNAQVMTELKKLDLLRVGRFDITRADLPDQPFSYTGFQMVNEEKLRELDSATLEALNKNGMLMLMHAQLFSLRVMRDLFERQSEAGKIPMPNAGAA